MKIKISNDWNFIPDFKKEYLKAFPTKSEKINLPHTVKEVPYNYFSENDYQFISTYKKDFVYDEKIMNDKVFLIFDGVMLKCHVYLNNKDLGMHISGYLPFTLDVTAAIKKGKNTLIVVVDSNEDPNIPPFGLVVDYLTYGGIYRDVFFETKPETYIEDLFVNADMTGKININLKANKDLDKSYKVVYELYDKDKLITKFSETPYIFKDKKLWDLDNPYLYNLVANLYKDNKLIDSFTRKFGFKTATFKQDGFYLNGNKIKLLGLNRHQAFPYVGYAMPKNSQEEDAYILKNEICVNCVRCSHYPPSNYFLNKCDELGLLVFDEIPGWQHLSKDQKWRDCLYDFTTRMVLKDRNFTSVIAYGVRVDESGDDHELYTKTNEIAHTLDPYRATTGVRNFKHSECLEDIYAYNDFDYDSTEIGLVNPKIVHKDKKPYIVSEFMGHMNPVKSFDNYPNRILTVLRYAKIIDDTFKYDSICGSIGWCAFDYNTHKDFGSGDHICYHGVYDMFRNSKYTGSIYASQQDKKPYLEVLSNMNIGDHPASMTGNLYIATNADYVEVLINDEKIGDFYPDTKDYPYTPHPLIKVDDYIGNRFHENMSKKDSKYLKDLMNYITVNGYSKLPLKMYIKGGLVMLHTHKTFNELMAIYNKYMQSWGAKVACFTFNAYKNNKVVLTKKVGASTKLHLKCETLNPTIYLDGSYETSRISIKLVDEYDSLMNYAFLPLKLETTGKIEIIGPKKVSLIGGQISVYVKAKDKGTGTLIINNERYNAKIKIDVK